MNGRLRTQRKSNGRNHIKDIATCDQAQRPKKRMVSEKVTAIHPSEIWTRTRINTQGRKIIRVTPRNCSYLRLGLHADIEGGDPRGQDAGEALAAEGVEEVETRRGEELEAPPRLHNPDARLVDAGAEQAVSAHHLLPPVRNEAAESSGPVCDRR